METSTSVGKSLIPSAVDRLLAGLIDFGIISIFCVIPILGWILAVVYFFSRDALSFMDGQSVGKRVMKLRVVHYEGLIPITEDYRASAMRQLTLILPIFNLIDLLMVFSTDRRRFGDQLAKTLVIKNGD